MKWRSDSEVVAGLVLSGRIDAEMVDVSMLHAPYDSIVQMKRDGKEDHELLDKVSVQALMIAREAEAHSPGEPLVYLKQLERSSLRAHVGGRLAPIVKKLERGEDADVSGALEVFSKLENGYHEFTTADEIDPQKMVYAPSYYPPIDKYIGGYPYAGLTIIAGTTGTGKTTMLIELAKSAASKKKHVAILTLEMTNSQFIYRMMQVDPELTKDKLKYIHMSDDVYTVDEVYSAASRLAAKYPLYFIGVDYADMLVGEKEQSEGVMGRIYHTMSVLAKKTTIPVILIAQYRRMDNRPPTIEDIRYSGRAEQAASMILLLHNTDCVWSRSRMAENNPLPYVEGVAYIVVGKLRFAGKTKKQIGAIAVNWEEDGGRWGRDAKMWYDLRGRV